MTGRLPIPSEQGSPPVGGMRSAELARFSQLVQLLTNSLMGGDEPWRAFLLALADYVGAEHATLILTPPDDPRLGMNITPSAPPHRAQEYLDRFLAIDPFVNLPEGKLMMMYEYAGPAMLDQASVYREWLEVLEASHVMGVDLKVSSGFEARLRLTRRPGEPEFDDQARARVEALLPHLRQTLELHGRLASSESEHLLLADAVEQFAVGTILLDHRLNVIRLNEVAAAILAEADGIRLAGQSLAFDSAATAREFRTAARAAISPPDNERRPILGVSRPSGRRQLALVVRAVMLPGFMQTGQAPAVAVFLTDPNRHRVVHAEAVRQLFSCTPAEAEIAAALANGLSVNDIADRSGVARNTVRAHVRSIFSKLGLSRQSQLIHLIHTGLPDAFGSDG